MVKINVDMASIILEYADYFEYSILFNILFPGCKQQCYKRNLVTTVNKYLDVRYTLFGKLHRENDLPAIEWDGGSNWWYLNDKFVKSYIHESENKNYSLIFYNNNSNKKSSSKSKV
jgi:hypothetical protein